MEVQLLLLVVNPQKDLRLNLFRELFDHQVEASSDIVGDDVSEKPSPKNKGTSSSSSKEEEITLADLGRKQAKGCAPADDAEEGMCGILRKSMYGTRDVAQNWER